MSITPRSLGMSTLDVTEETSLEMKLLTNKLDAVEESIRRNTMEANLMQR